MQVAVVDLGSVALRYEIHDLTLSKGNSLILKGRNMCRMFGGDTLSPEAKQKALDAITELKEALESHKVTIVKAVATSAFREAKDGPEFLEKLSKLLGTCLLYTSPSPRDATLSRMPSSA